MIRVHGGQPSVPDTCCEESPSSLGPAKPCISPPVRVFPGCLGRFTCLLVCFILCGCLFSRGSRSIGAGSSTESFHFKLVSERHLSRATVPCSSAYRLERGFELSWPPKQKGDYFRVEGLQSSSRIWLSAQLAASPSQQPPFAFVSLKELQKRTDS